MDNDKYFIDENYTANPVLTFNSSNVEQYWTTSRIHVSKFFQFHVYEFARKVFLKNGFESIVDIGAGPGTKMKLFFKDIAKEVAIVDQPTTRTVAAQVFPEAKYFAANLEDVSFSTSARYDMVICSDVIEHLANPDALLSIVRNHVKKKNGLVVLSTPDREFRWGLNNKQSPNKQHVREWNARELKKYVEHAGFEVIEHVHFPLKRLPKLLFNLSRLPWLYKRIMKRTWYPNQTLLMRLKND